MYALFSQIAPVTQICQGDFFTHSGTVQYPNDGILHITISAAYPPISPGNTIWFKFANTSIDLTSGTPVPGSNSMIGPIIGGAVGGTLLLVLLLVVTFLVVRLRRKRKVLEAKQEIINEERNIYSNPEETDATSPDLMASTPFYGSDTPVTGQTISPVWALPPDHTDLPPVYEDSPAFGVTLTQPTPLQLFVAAHPAWISPELGVKLRNAGYNPALDPDLMSAEHWLDKYGVDGFELASLKEAFGA